MFFFAGKVFILVAL